MIVSSPEEMQLNCRKLLTACGEMCSAILDTPFEMESEVQ